MRVAEVLPHVRTASFDRALSYIVPDGMELAVGDVVRVPLGRREVYGYVVARSGTILTPGRLRPIGACTGSPRAFDAAGLALARWMAERYCCSLGEALGAIVAAGSVPRVIERLVPRERPAEGRLPSVPARLVRLVWGELVEGFSLERLLNHPEARRAGDRRTLLQAVSALVRAGALERTRAFGGARVREAQERVLELGESSVSGPRVAALVAQVRVAGGVRRADALLGGFSAATIARAVRGGALREVERRPSNALAVTGNPPDLVPTHEQQAAIERLSSAVAARTFSECVLQGVTGSGKTFVYISVIAQLLKEGGHAIVLVPEISLTPQLARRFEAAFGDLVTVLHSALSERERYDGWYAAARGEKKVVVGARSAVFAPLNDVRLIVVDEAHERTYKQDRTPRYQAIDVARERVRASGGVLLLGSATPPLEAFEATRRGQSGRIVLTQRATALPLPPVEIVDMAAEFGRGNRRIFSTALVEALERRLERREKTVLFVNRRGSAGFVLCRSCGYVPECVRCSISLTVHRAESLLRCHLCDAQAPLPQVCPRCAGPLREFGVGTQKVAETVQTLFPQATVVRMDSDTTTHVGDHARLLDEFAERGDVLVGTQMVAKGLDFPTVTLVGVVAADIGLHLPDFRAAERTFDLLTQVAGRSGRARLGVAIVQTYSPQNPAITFAARHDYDGFARLELEERRTARYPPYVALVYLGIFGRRIGAVIQAARCYAEMLRSLAGVEVLGPAPDPIPRMNAEWRYRIAVKAADSSAVRAYLRETLQPAARSERDTRLVVNIDP